MPNPAPPPPESLRARRLAANLGFLFTELPFLDRFAAAAAAGFTAVEFLFPYAWPAEAIAGQLAQHGLAPVLFNAPPGDWDAGERGLAAVPGREAEFRESIGIALDWAGRLGVRQVHVMAGIADPADPAARETWRRNMAAAAGLAAPRGVRLLVEPINRIDMPGYFLADFDLAAGLVADVPGIGLQFDIYHCHRLGEDVPARLAALLPVIRHIQIAGVPGRHEPAEPALPLRELFALLDRAGYAGRVGCEYRPLGGTLEGLGWIEDLEARLA
jgi:hydroxypyruvate isomerase